MTSDQAADDDAYQLLVLKKIAPALPAPVVELIMRDGGFHAHAQRMWKVYGMPQRKVILDVERLGWGNLDRALDLGRRYAEELTMPLEALFPPETFRHKKPAAAEKPKLPRPKARFGRAKECGR